MNGFEIQILPEKGRSMIALKSYKAGDTIIEEEPFVSCQFSWNSMYGYLACDHCMRPLETTIKNVRRLTNNSTIEIPFPEHCPTKNWLQQFTSCPQCGVQYCSEDCRIEAFKKYHSIGCMAAYKSDDTHPINVLNETWKKMHYPPETGTIMLIVRLLAMYKQCRNKEEFLDILKSFQSICVNEEKKIYHKILGVNFETQMEQLFQAFCNAFQEEEFAMFTTPDAFKSLMAMIGTNSQGIATSPFAEWVKKVSDLEMPQNTKDELDKYIDDLYFKVNEFAGEFLNNEGSGLYTLQSKINHSCIPNAQSSFPYSNDIVVLKAITSIQSGEEICISYLDDCQLERSRHSRQKELKENYLFICNCPKCLEQTNDADETSEDESEGDDVDMEDEDD